MKNLTLFLLIVLTFFGCVSTPKLAIRSGQTPTSLGINIVNNANISEADWQIFKSATEDFVQSYNAYNSGLELYTTTQDSNAVNLIFDYNKFITTGDQIAGAVITSAGLITPFLLAAYQAPIILAFCYLPKNSTSLTKSFSTDLDSSRTMIPVNFKSGPVIGNLNRQKRRQRNAYYYFLKQLMNEIHPGQTLKAVPIVKDKGTKLKMKDGRIVYCKVVSEDQEFLFIELIKNEKTINTKVEREKIAEVSNYQPKTY